MLRVYCSWPGTSAMMNRRRAVAKHRYATSIVIPCSRSAFRPSVKQGEVNLVPLPRRGLAHGGDVVLVERLALVQQAADQRALAVVHAADRGEPEQLGLFVLPEQAGRGPCQKYPSRFFCSIEPSMSWSMRRVMRSECRADWSSWMISGTVFAVERTAPVQG